jgi:asparagine N-glycosylation enzyme membrane subunit Stt3
MPWPAGHPVALAAIFKFFGDATAVAFAWSAVLSALTVLFVFWAALELFGDERGALAAAFLWAASPLALRYAGACDSTAASLFWCAAAFASLAARESEPGPALDAFAAATLAYAVQVRFENAFLIVYAAFAVRRRALLAPAALGLVFPAAIAWVDHLETLPGLTPSSFAPWANFIHQAPGNLAFLAAPVSLGLIAAPAALASLGRAPARRLALLAAALFVLYGCYYHGAFTRDTDDRYYLSMLLPLSLAAAPALSAAAIPAVLLMAGLAWRSAPGADAAHQASQDFLTRSAQMIPERAYVLAFNPPFVRETAGRPSAWVDLLVDDPAAFERGRAAAGAVPELVLYKDWAWRSRPDEAERLKGALREAYDERTLAENGTDKLVLLTPRR